MVGAVAGFNLICAGQIVPHAHTTWETLSWESRHFVLSFFRSLLTYWHGPLKGPWVWTFVGTWLLVAAWAVSSLRRDPDPEERRIWRMGLAILAAVWLLRLIWYFGMEMRLTGYGLLLLALACRPKSGSQARWALYAALSIGFSILNMTTVNALGANDPRYERLAQELKAKGLPSEKLLTNSFRILDLHTGTPTWPVKEIPAADEGAYFLKVTLPAYDPVSATVWPVSLDSHWREVYSVPGATLFQKTEMREGP